MANRYVEYDSQGFLAEKEALDISAGVIDAGKIVALDSNGMVGSIYDPTSCRPSCHN